MIKDVLLNNGVKMPQEGFGVFQITDLAQCTQVVLDAIETGYRLFDTAAAYNNEAAVGEAIRQSGLKREEFFITTKIGMGTFCRRVRRYVHQPRAESHRAKASADRGASHSPLERPARRGNHPQDRPQGTYAGEHLHLGL